MLRRSLHRALILSIMYVAIVWGPYPIIDHADEANVVSHLCRACVLPLAHARPPVPGLGQDGHDCCLLR